LLAYLILSLFILETTLLSCKR